MEGETRDNYLRAWIRCFRVGLDLRMLGALPELTSLLSPKLRERLMRMLRFLQARRLVFGLGLLGMLFLASGCGDSNPVTSIDPSEGKAKGEAQQKAREAAYGKGGIPPSEKNATKR
jgi:hypothetical protein